MVVSLKIYQEMVKQMSLFVVIAECQPRWSSLAAGYEFIIYKREINRRVELFDIVYSKQDHCNTTSFETC
jgi:hypothetical protein